MSEAAAAPAAPAGNPADAQSPARAVDDGASRGGQKPGGETPAQAEARRLKLRIDNQDVELDESEVVANYRKGRDASKLLSKVEQRRQEALRAKAEADGIFSRLKTDPRGVLRELGVDLRGLSEKTILEEIELEKMSPAERRAYDAEQKLKAFESEKQKQEEERQQAAHKEEVARHQDEFANLFLQTMEAVGLPKQSGRFVAHRMAHLYQQNEEAGLESSPEEMAAYVMQGLQNEHRGVLGGLKGPQLLEYLGPQVVREVLAGHLTEVRKKKGVAAAPARPAPTAKPATGGFHPVKGRMADIERLLRED